MPTHPTDQGPLTSQFAGDADMLELLDMFVSELGARSEQMRDLLASRRMDALRTVAHQLKGAAGGYGYPMLSQAAGVLESQLAAPVRDLGEVAHAVAELQSICDRAIRGHRPAA